MEIESRCNPHEALTLVTVMTGALIFTADLMRAFTRSVQVIPVDASRYGGGRTAKRKTPVVVFAEAEWDRGAVVLVDDICDEGYTLKTVKAHAEERAQGPVMSCALLLREPARKRVFTPDFVGFKLNIPDFVVGYGLDFHGHWRNLPYIASVENT